MKYAFIAFLVLGVLFSFSIGMMAVFQTGFWLYLTQPFLNLGMSSALVFLLLSRY